MRIKHKGEGKKKGKETHSVLDDVAVIVVRRNQPHAVVIKRFLDVGALVLLGAPISGCFVEPTGPAIEKMEAPLSGDGGDHGGQGEASCGCEGGAAHCDQDFRGFSAEMPGVQGGVIQD